jgi:hypothetical protein
MVCYDCTDNTVKNGPKDANLLASNYYYFSIDKLPQFNLFVQSANLPMISSRSINQPITLGTYPKIPAQNYYFDDLQISFLVNSDMSNWISIYEWMKGIGNLKEMTTEGQLDYDDQNAVFSTASLLVTNSAYKPILSAKFHYVWPKNLGGINFTTQNTTYEPITCTVNFAYSYYELVPVGVTC